MTDFIQELSAPGLQQAMDQNMAAFWSCYGCGAGCELHEDANGVWFYTGIPIPLNDGVVLARFDARDVDEVVEVLRTRIARHGAPALWWSPPPPSSRLPASRGSTGSRPSRKQGGEASAER